MEKAIGMFGDLSYDYAKKQYEEPAGKINQILEYIRAADEGGIAAFGLGEHHRPDYVISVPEMVLAAAAPLTQNIKLGSSVTVLSSSEPVNVYQNFATLDLISKGRAEIQLGRGSFTESFPLFGYSLKDYDVLFEEKLDLFLKINNEKNVTWSGTKRAAMNSQTVYPRAFEERIIPVWIAVGGTPQSVMRAARLGLPIIFAIIGGQPAQFKPLIDFYKQEYLDSGHEPEKMKIGIHAHTLIVNDERKIRKYYEKYAEQMNRIGKERGWPPYSYQQYEAGRSSDGALFIGHTEQVQEKILRISEYLGVDRFTAHIDVGAPEHDDLLETIHHLSDMKL